MGNQVFSSAIRFAELLNHGDLVRMSLAISIRFSPPVRLSGLPVRLWRKMLETGAAKKIHSVRSSFFLRSEFEIGNQDSTRHLLLRKGGSEFVFPELDFLESESKRLGAKEKDVPHVSSGRKEAERWR